MKPKTIWITRNHPDGFYEMWSVEPTFDRGQWFAQGLSGYMGESTFEAVYPASWHLGGGEDSIIEVELHG